MKSYQVFDCGEVNGKQYCELRATYFNKDKALTHAKQITNFHILNSEVLGFDSNELTYSEHYDGKCLTWYLHKQGSPTTIAEIREIEF